MTQWTSTVCETNGIKLYYTSTATAKPTIVLLHGLTANGACWTPLAQALEKDYHIIMADARGHGQSSVPDYGYRYEDLASDVIGLLNSLRIPAPVLVGHSMGGMTAAVVAARSPELLGGLILADPTFLSPEVQREVRDSDVAEKHRLTLGRSLEEVSLELKTSHPKRSPEIIELIARAKLQTSMAAFDVLTPPLPPFRQLASEIDVPTMLVFGDKGVVSPVTARELQHLNPKFQSHEIPEAGHGLHYDQPERFSAIVRSFIHSIGTGL